MLKTLAHQSVINRKKAAPPAFPPRPTPPPRQGVGCRDLFTETVSVILLPRPAVRALGAHPSISRITPEGLAFQGACIEVDGVAKSSAPSATHVLPHTSKPFLVLRYQVNSHPVVVRTATWPRGRIAGLPRQICVV